MFYKILLLCFLAVLHCVVPLPLHNDELNRLGESHPRRNNNALQLWLTISARQHFLEVSWVNAPAHEADNIILTRQAPTTFEKFSFDEYTPLAPIDETEGSAFVPLDGYTTNRLRPDLLNNESGSGFDAEKHVSADAKTPAREYWLSNNGPQDFVAAIKPTVNAQWFTTGVSFNFSLSQQVDSNTGCYGFWASYINGKGQILATNCVRAYPRWMHELRDTIGNLRLRDLFIPGTHDAGSLKPLFDPLVSETVVTKYSLCQDDDIRGQLMHGSRYLDLRIGYYKNLAKKFYINHGVTRHRALDEVIDQIKKFVRETNEIVIVGLKEFPVGFGKDLTVHRLLVNYLREHFGDTIVHPSASWGATLRDIWSRKQNVILAYDERPVVNEFPHILFESVQQRWGNVQTWSELQKYLRQVNEYDVSRWSSRPVSDMAELTPTTWDVIGDTLGGLRKMADDTNWRISKLYRDELSDRANIVAVDFIRGTSLMDLAIEVNKRKIPRY